MKKSCCFFGSQRPLTFGERDEVFPLLLAETERLINEGYTDFVFGGYTDFDSIARLSVMSLRSKYPHIRLVYVKLNDRDIERLLKTYDEVIRPDIKYKGYSIRVRNRAVIELCDYCVFYVSSYNTGNSGIERAKSSGKPYINLAEVKGD